MRLNQKCPKCGKLHGEADQYCSVSCAFSGIEAIADRISKLELELRKEKKRSELWKNALITRIIKGSCVAEFIEKEIEAEVAKVV